MGIGGYFVCKGCGFQSAEIWFGIGFESGPDNPSVREKILRGEYGAKPKRVLESNPDAHFHSYMEAFRCRCGNFSSKSTVCILSSAGVLYEPTRRCGRCRRMMEVLRDPDIQICPKCHCMRPMVFETTVLWD